MSDTLTKLIMVLGILLFDIVIFLLLRRSFPILSTRWRVPFNMGYWTISSFVLACFWFLDLIFMGISSYANRKVIISWIALVLVSKILVGVYLVLDEFFKAGGALWQKFRKDKTHVDRIVPQQPKVSRKKFLYRSALMLTSFPLALKGFSIINQAYDYQVRRVRIVLPNLPKAFDGIRIAQISDIHAGSFKNKTAVQGGVDMILGEKPDMVFFTGDLVNRQSDEINEYFDTFSKVAAPLGVFSVLGNHDYGEYRSWGSQQEKQQDFRNMLKAHQQLGWKLLRNENHLINENGESLAILGVENWGVRRFSKYGKLDVAYQGTEEAAVRLLLSHDPSHWEAKVLDYSDIDVTFSGHTHGFQFGIEAGQFKWSPSQYLYKQWAGLYQKQSQHIYVNRGYGFIGMPGRVGISPEITVIELVREA